MTNTQFNFLTSNGAMYVLIEDLPEQRDTLRRGFHLLSKRGYPVRTIFDTDSAVAALAEVRKPEYDNCFVSAVVDYKLSDRTVTADLSREEQARAKKPGTHFVQNMAADPRLLSVVYLSANLDQAVQDGQATGSLERRLRTTQRPPFVLYKAKTPDVPQDARRVFLVTDDLAKRVLPFTSSLRERACAEAAQDVIASQYWVDRYLERRSL